tara:strand:- start:16 stop:1623 length:1608 start_codon:yes stop_codon:yes gene_type:complete
MEQQENKDAVVYCRVSTDEQAERGLSMDVQAKDCRAKLEAEGYTVLEVLRDDGKTGSNMRRDGLQKLLALAEAGAIQAVCSVHSDRISRSMVDSAYIREKLQKLSVRILYVNQQESDGSSASFVTDNVLAVMSQYHLVVTSEKVKATQRAKVEAGYLPSVPPVGYLNADNPDKNADRLSRKIIITDPERAPLISETFRLYATGNYNVVDLCDLMYKKGLMNRNGKQMSYSRFYDLLKNRFYLGEIHYANYVNKNAKHEPLVDEAVFNHVQTILQTKNNHACRKRKHQFLLRGFVYCPIHRKRYTAEWHLGKTKAYYHCPNRSGCGKYSEMTALEGAIADKFKDLQFSDEFIQAVIKKVSSEFYEQRRIYNGRKQSLINKRTAFEKQLAIAEDKLLNNVLDDAAFKGIRARVRENIENINQQIHDLENTHDLNIDVASEVMAFTQDIYKTYDEADPELKRHLLGFFWERFEVHEGVIINSTPTLIFQELLKLERIYTKNARKNQNAKNRSKRSDFSATSPEVINKIPLLRGQDSNL